MTGRSSPPNLGTLLGSPLNFQRKHDQRREDGGRDDVQKYVHNVLNFNGGFVRIFYSLDYS